MPVPEDAGRRPDETKATPPVAMQHDPCRGSRLPAGGPLATKRHGAATIPVGNSPATRGVLVAGAWTGRAELAAEPANRAMTGSVPINHLMGHRRGRGKSSAREGVKSVVTFPRHAHHKDQARLSGRREERRSALLTGDGMNSAKCIGLHTQVTHLGRDFFPPAGPTAPAFRPAPLDCVSAAKPTRSRLEAESRTGQWWPVRPLPSRPG